MKITSSRFERSATGPAGEPRAPGPDIVFMGRSNVGKSSLINRLLGVKGLARTSSSPGRTQVINFYRVNESCYFVDLPGYGYAKVPEAVRRSWKPMIEGYLDRRRERIALAIVVVDARRGDTELDAAMREWLDSREVPYLVAATKSDKLSSGEQARIRRETAWNFGDSARCERPVLVSVNSGLGIREVWRHLDLALVGYNQKA